MRVYGKLKESLNQLDNCDERISKTISVVNMSYLGCTCLCRYKTHNVMQGHIQDVNIVGAEC